ncbi:hypothetical protein FIE12Z_12607 [Fusarium flagelliforme]|uniref:Heterokaryon incompatibility domain-containing protein n=2 Tax=Fusarium flagelliforme TaxID=2675880 RepID=A0A395M5P6_9HYPO|nr:hypothetical protein FIE12Z_12607 [Fusarium flagelliforme]
MGILNILPVIANESDERRFEDYKARCRDIPNRAASGGLEKITHMASNWLEECRQGHLCCKVSRNADQEKVLPTRLIDVGLDKQQPKLISPDYNLLDLEYSILSYAWGPATDFAKTTSSNLQAMSQSLPWDGLPKTVQDAIVLTRKLGVGYLWVDALCILQSEGPDDMKHRKDWSYEAERFGHYYQNALLTISATGAISSHEGLFLPRSDMILSPKSVSLQHIDLTLRSFIPSWETELEFPPLASRGWALQERFLSKRILHFGQSLILWECQESRATELDPAGLDPRGPEGRYRSTPSQFLSTFRNLDSEEVSLNILMHQWLDFVSIYSRADFSYYSDRLPALSGIANIIQKKIKQRYIAGLWEPAFTQGLMWNSGRPATGGHLETEQSKTDEQQLKVPSWSWAANRHRVFFSVLPCWKLVCKIEECDVKSRGSETSGQLLSWRLRLRGSFQRLNLSDMGLERHDDARFNLFESSRACAPMYVYLDSPTGSQIPDRAYPCLLVGLSNRYTKDKEKDEDERRAHALVLQSTGRLSESVEQYRRIGTLDIMLKDWKAENPEERAIELV